jgi:transcriptional regulator with XRE-family HTH domain
MYMRPPSGCLVDKPTTVSVLFAGRYVNTSAIARSSGLNQAYISKILLGSREPTIHIARRVAASLGMGLEDMLEAIEERAKLRKQKNSDILQQHETRLAREDSADLRRAKAGLPVIPRMSGLRQE